MVSDFHNNGYFYEIYVFFPLLMRNSYGLSRSMAPTGSKKLGVQIGVVFFEGFKPDWFSLLIFCNV